MEKYVEYVEKTKLTLNDQDKRKYHYMNEIIPIVRRQSKEIFEEIKSSPLVLAPIEKEPENLIIDDTTIGNWISMLFFQFRSKSIKQRLFHNQDLYEFYKSMRPVMRNEYYDYFKDRSFVIAKKEIRLLSQKIRNFNKFNSSNKNRLIVSIHNNVIKKYYKKL